MLLTLASQPPAGRIIAPAPPPVLTPALLDTDSQFQLMDAGTPTATNTLASANGCSIIVAAFGDLGRFSAPTDNKGNGSYTLLRTSGYAGGLFAPFGLNVYGKANAAGGAGHVITVSKSNPTTYEFTLMSAAVAGTVIEDSSIVARASNQSQVSASVTTAGPARLIAIWGGDADVNDNPKTTAPVGAEWTMPESDFRDSTAYIQAALATREVGAGTHTVTWTQPNASQGAILALVAIKA